MWLRLKHTELMAPLGQSVVEKLAFYGDSGRAGAGLGQWVGFPRSLSTFRGQVVVKRGHYSCVHCVLFIIFIFIADRPWSMRGDQLRRCHPCFHHLRDPTQAARLGSGCLYPKTHLTDPELPYPFLCHIMTLPGPPPRRLVT